MSTTTLTTSDLGASAEAAAYAARPAPAPIPSTRLLGVELRKMFDTRSGSWLLASIALTALIATVAVILLAPEDALTYDTFAAAVGFPMAVILPIVAILSVTSEWSQRSGLTTFTLVPHRGRVIGAKAVVSIAVGVASMLLAMAIGVVGNIVGTAITGAPLVWDASVQSLVLIVLGNVIGLLIGFMLGVLIRSSAGAVVAYFVYSFVVPSLSMALAQTQEWFAERQAWIDVNAAQAPLFDQGVLTGEQWAQLGFTCLVWLVVPLVVGLRLVLRSEVK